MTQPRPRTRKPPRATIRVDADVASRLAKVADDRVTSPEHLASLLLRAALDAVEAEGPSLQFTITRPPAIPRVAPPHPLIMPGDDLGADDDDGAAWIAAHPTEPPPRVHRPHHGIVGPRSTWATIATGPGDTTPNEDL